VWGALLAVVLLLAGVSGAFRAGVHLGARWSATRAEGGEDAAPWGPPVRGGRWPMHRGHWGRPMHGGFLGRFLSLLLVLLGLGALFKLFAFKAWHLHRHAPWGPGPHPRAPHPHAPWPHGPHPHGWWGREPCGGKEGQSEESETDADETDTSETDEQVAKVGS
jgi:hypothetical protein